MWGNAGLLRLYLDPRLAGVPWLFDPDSGDLARAVRASASRGPADECDVDAVLADLPDLVELLRQRHFGLATGRATVDLEAWLSDWRARLIAERPDTWGVVFGDAMQRLRWLIGDNHLRATGEDKELLARADPRRDEPFWTGDSAPASGRPDATGAANSGGEPAVSEAVIDGVQCLRVSTLDNTAELERQLADWVAGHQRHFAHERIIVDFRGNGGGNDGFTFDWCADHVPARIHLSTDDSWTLDDQPLILWNYPVLTSLADGPDAVPRWMAASMPKPNPDSRLTVDAREITVEAGQAPWHGRMLVLTDRYTRSSGESSAWLLRDAFGARLVGGRSAGFLEYGNVVPYLLPRSGMRISLASKTGGIGDVEMVGLPVDVELDPRTPIAEIAADFDRIHDRAPLS